MTLEIVASTVRSCVAAERGGASRIELCAALGTAGVTPSSGMIRAVKEAVTIPVFVIIRPREGDFIYSEEEIQTMELEIDEAKTAGADGIVFGCLTTDGLIDKETTKRLVAHAAPWPVVFHRAFDVCADLSRALEDIIECGCIRILTSGGQPKINAAGIEMIHQLADQANGRIAIMPGGGVTTEVVPLFDKSKITNVHTSARVNIDSPAANWPSGNIFETNWAETDESIVREFCALWK
ncbi:MAG: copper homeostasis protein CutC [Flavobacteriales bacterium]